MKTGLRANLVGILGTALLLTAAAPPDSPVADAAMRGDVAGVRALLQQGADVNAAQGDGMTALHWAAQRAESEIASMLIYAGASVDATTRIGDYTPLHLAGSAGAAEVVKLLVESGANVNAVTTNSGASPLHLAAKSGSVEAVSAMVEAGAEVNAQERTYRQTPLVFAAAMNRSEVVGYLLEQGADPGLYTDPVVGVGDQEERTRIEEIVEALEADGGQPTPAQLQGAIAAGRKAREAAVRAAREEGLEDEINGAGRTPPGGLTALLHAARQGHVESVRALLDGGADVNQASITDGTTPILMAAINSQWDVAMLLLERGADPNPASQISGNAPLWATINAQYQPRTRFPQPQEGWYQQASYMDVLEALLVSGADPDARATEQPYYMTFSGCGNGNCGLTRLDGTTALFRAAHSADVTAMRLLVKYGADPFIPRGADDEVSETDIFAGIGGGGGRGGGRGGFRGSRDEDEDDEDAPPPVPTAPATAIHAAAGLGYGQGVGAGNANRFMENGWLPSVRYLVEELGFDVNARDDGGFTPMHFAAARGDNEMILYLVEKGGDVMAASTPSGSFPTGYTTVDMANGPRARITPIPATIALLESLGAKNNRNCQSCE